MHAVEQLGHAQALGGQLQTSGPVLVVGPSGQRKTVAGGVPRILVCSLVRQNKGNHEEAREVCRALMVLSIARVNKKSSVFCVWSDGSCHACELEGQEND